VPKIPIVPVDDIACEISFLQLRVVGRGIRMKPSRIIRRPLLAFLACGYFAMAAVGCQTHMAGQTLPSPYYLRDDVQFYRAGPETQLPNQRRAIEEYELSQQNLDGGFGEDAP